MPLSRHARTCQPHAHILVGYRRISSCETLGASLAFLSNRIPFLFVAMLRKKSRHNWRVLMKVRAQILLKNGLIASAVGVAALLLAGTASAQQYTGAGSTWQQRQPYYMPQQQQPAHRPVPMPTYRPNVVGPGGNRFQYVPELGNWVPTQLTPQTANRIYDASAGCVKRGAEGAAWGAAGGGRRGGAVGFAQGCLNR